MRRSLRRTGGDRVPLTNALLLKLAAMLCICNNADVADNGEELGRRRRSLHNRLAVLRAERGVSRAALAQAVGVNTQTVGFLERGDYGPSLELALRICAYFHLPV